MLGTAQRAKPMTAPSSAAPQPLNLSQRAVISHLAGIAAPTYEIGVFDAAADDGDGQMLLRKWTATEVLHAFDWLRWKNAQRCEIYVRPAAPHAYNLLDDLSRDAIDQLHAEGFAPSVVIESSPNNFQAWLHHGENLPPPVSTEAARILAKRFGADPGSADWRHFGRLAGFTNNKPKHRRLDGYQPFVLLHESHHCTYRQAPAVIAQARLQVDQAEALLVEQAAIAASRAHIPKRATKTISAFHADPRYDGDLNRADLAYAIYALDHGCTEESVGEALRERDLSKKGSLVRQEQYIKRTLRKAAQAPHDRRTAS